MELIKIESAIIGQDTVQSVNARDLHAFLEVRSEFRNWIKNRIDDFGFVEGSDYVTSVEIYRGGERKEYALTLDMAKELAMVERNEKGKQARAYFIECERRAKAPGQSASPANLSRLQLIEIAMQAEQERLVLADQVEAIKPDIEAFDRIAKSDGSLCITDAAKTLQVRPKDLFAFLRSHGWIYSRPGTADAIAYQSKLAAGFLEHKTTTVTRSDGSEKTVSQARVTPKGLARLAREFAPVAMIA